MPRGFADFGLNPNNVGQYSGDSGELAVRLGSFDTLERRGHVIWYDDMKNAMYQYQQSLYGTATVKYLLDYGHLNGVSLTFTPDVVAVGGCDVRSGAPLLTMSKVGFEFLIRPHKDGVQTATVFDWAIEIYLGLTYQHYHFRLDPNTAIFSLWRAPGGGGTQTTIFTSPYPTYTAFQDRGFSYIKVVVDPTLVRFDRIVYNTLGAGLTAYGGCTDVSVSRPRIEILLAAAGNNDKLPVNISYPIVTIDEP